MLSLDQLLGNVGVMRFSMGLSSRNEMQTNNATIPASRSAIDAFSFSQRLRSWRLQSKAACHEVMARTFLWFLQL